MTTITEPGITIAPAHPVPANELAILGAMEKKVRWLSSWMIHHANHIRPNRFARSTPSPSGAIPPSLPSPGIFSLRTFTMYRLVSISEPP